MWKQKFKSNEWRPYSHFFIQEGLTMWQMSPHSIYPDPLTWIFLMPLFSLIWERHRRDQGCPITLVTKGLLKSTWRDSDQKSLITVPTWCLFPVCLSLAALGAGLQRVRQEGTPPWNKSQERPTMLIGVSDPPNNVRLNVILILLLQKPKLRESTHHTQDVPAMKCKSGDSTVTHKTLELFFFPIFCMSWHPH
jgi:hypothetical protein